MTQQHCRDNKRKITALRTLVNAWDPVKLLSLGAPEDEYDCFVNGLYSLLKEGATRKRLSAFIQCELSEHFHVVVDQERIGEINNFVSHVQNRWRMDQRGQEE